jgi:tRNA(fMet)-specific endonuclease VapC
MRIALDTNRYVDLCRGKDGVAEVLEMAEAICLPFVVLGELRAGFAVGRKGAQNERMLRRFLMKEGVSVLYADEQTTHTYASVFRQLRGQGTPIPTNDIWIAALVLQHDLLLYARDQHFDQLPQLARI